MVYASGNCLSLIFAHLGWLVVKDHQVSVTNVETRQMITGVLCIKDVFIGNIGSASGVIGISTEKKNMHLNR